jgi:predicted kinase
MKSLQLNKPHLIVMIGLPGSGKSTFAKQFALTFNAPFVDYAELQQLFGDSSSTTKVADYMTSQLLRTQQTIIVDGPGEKMADRREFYDLAKKNGYAPLFIWVQTEPATAKFRAVTAKTGTMTKIQFETRVADFENPTKAEPVLVISGKHTYPSQARTVLKKLVAEHPLTVGSKITTPPPRSPITRGRIIR